MKKLSLFLMAILAFGLTSCDDTFVEPTPQSNPQEPIIGNYDLKVEKGANIMGALDLNSIESNIEVIKTISVTPVLEDNQKVEYIAYLSNTEDFADQIALDVVDGNLSKTDVDAAFRELFGKASKPKDMFIRFAAFLADGTSRVRYGTQDTYYAPATVSVTATPVTPGELEAIYLVGNANGWDINSDKCRLESTDGDDIFVGVFDLKNNGDNNFRFYSALGNWDEGSIGSQKDDKAVDISGDFVKDFYKGKVVEGKGGFKLTIDGTYKITVNLNSYTMKMQKINEDPSKWTYVYMVGDINGWGNSADATAGQMVCKTNDNKYTATLTLPDSDEGMSYFRFLKKLDGTWASQLGTSEGKDEILEFDEGVSMAVVAAGKEGSFKVPAGKYKVELDLNENLMIVTQVTE